MGLAGRRTTWRTDPYRSVIDTSGYDWEGDRPLDRPIEDTIIYEMHVRGFTCSPSSGVGHPGTFIGVIERIPYLRDLGITAVELMPVFEFDETDVLRVVDGVPLTNYWGYSTVGFFAPQTTYCVSTPWGGSHFEEFRDMGQALHAAEHRGDPRRGVQSHRRGQRELGPGSVSSGSRTAPTASGAWGSSSIT